MKTLIALLFIAATLHAASSKPVVKNGMVCRTIQADAELRDWIVGIQKAAESGEQRADAAESEAKASRDQSAIAGVKLEEADAKLGAVQKAYDEKVAEAASEHARAEKEAKESNRRGNFIGWLAAGLFLVIGTQIMRIVPAPWSLAVPFVAAPAGYFLARWII